MFTALLKTCKTANAMHFVMHRDGKKKPFRAHSILRCF